MSKRRRRSGWRSPAKLPTFPVRRGVRFAEIPDHSPYIAGSDGSVWSCYTRQGHAMDGWRELTLCNVGRYLYVMVGAKRFRAVHRLVLLAFRGLPPSSRHIGRHFNGDGKDNNLKNLFWATQSENLADRERHGTALRGTRNGSAKLTENIVKACRARFAKGTLDVKEEAEALGVAEETLRRAIRKETWSHI